MHQGAENVDLSNMFAHLRLESEFLGLSSAISLNHRHGAGMTEETVTLY